MCYVYIVVDCKWDNYGNWSECDKSCDGGTQYRVRLEKISAKNGGKPCDGSAREDRECNAHKCAGI